MNPLSSITPTLPAGPVPSVDGRGGKGPNAVQVAKDFESVLLTKVVEEMGKTVETSGIDDAGGEQVYDLFYSQLGQDLAAKGGFGLWKQIAHQIGAPASAPEPVQETLQ